MNSDIDQFKIWLKNQTDTYLIDLKEKADDAYYNSGNPILTDIQWDLLNTYLTDKNLISITKIGHKVKNAKNKILLPHKLWSLDKANNDNQFNKWNNKNIHSNYIWQDKIDGVSGLFIQRSNKRFLYTRGDGITGSDISYLIENLNIPKFDKDITIRGEIIISKNNFDKYTKLYSNSRNMVSGCVNSTVVKEEFDDLEFVCYELFNTGLKPSEQLMFLKSKNCKIVNYTLTDSASYESIEKYLIQRKEEGQYIIDGIVVQPDKKYTRETDKNPSYAVAVKTLLQNNIGSSTVVKVHWNICKWNIIKPKVEIVPTKLNGITIQFLTAYNAKYIKDNFICKGSHLTFTRSGDVIPKILNVCNANKTYDMPDIPYKWNDTKIDIISISNDTSSSEIKHIYNFFSMINVKNMGEKTICKFYEAGYNSINKILNMKACDISQIEGFADKSSIDIFSNVHKRCKEVKLYEIIAASGTLGKGFSGKKCKDLIYNIPDILTKNRPEEELISAIEQINGFSNKSAKQVASRIKEVKQFVSDNSDFFNIHENNIEYTKPESDLIKIVFSQVRPDSILKQKLQDLNYEICDNINQKVTYLVVKQKETKTTKILKAEKLNITIYTLEEFVTNHINC